MLRKYIRELTTEELTEVYFNNEKLREMVLSDIDKEIETAAFKKFEYIKSGLEHYEIGLGVYSEIKIDLDNVDKVIDGLELLEKESTELSFLNETDQKYLDVVKRTNKEFQNSVYTSMGEFKRLEEVLKDDIISLEAILEDNFDLEFDPYLSKTDFAVEQFIDHYSQEHLSPDAFIEGDNFTLYVQRTYNFDEGGFMRESEKVLDKGNEMDF